MESSQPYLEAPGTEPAPPYYPETYTPEPAQRPPWYKRVGGGIAAVALLIAKFAAKLKLLLVLLPKLKLFTTAGSMLVSVGAYSLIWGWKFAAGFVVLLLVHEMGHVIQLRREGVPASAPLFIPFLGAVVGMKRLPDDAAAEARVGLAGPVLGSFGALAALALWYATGNDLFRALAFIAFFLNLFNLLPVLPLDGGRAMSALTPWMWLIGYAALIAVTFVFPNPIMLIILVFGGIELYRRWKQRNTPDGRRYYKVSPASRVFIAFVYVGLAAALAFGMHASHLPRTFHNL
jgi:Zn-dependent protease